ncbi:MAG: hypothetical protein JOZ31_06330 [Verrucomicrobia bacterium]|nr:hypothetical protein [Verrucomicrobiota bacterium]MBV8485116.1 hypothetical protein [Verrucomicrobiota bacterium]
MKVIASDRRLPLTGELSARSQRVDVSEILASDDVCGGSSSESVAESSWCCLRCRRNEETLTASRLRASFGVEVFCPRIRFRQVSQKRGIWVSEPLFPGYFFAKLDPQVLAETNGVSEVVKLGDGYAVASEELIRKLKYQTRATETGDLRSVFVPGERWRSLDGIVDGPDIIILEILSGRERVRLLFEFFQQQAGAQLSEDDLFPSIASGFELLKFAARVCVHPARLGVRRGLQYKH